MGGGGRRKFYVVEFGGLGIDHEVSGDSPGSRFFGGLRGCSWGGIGGYAGAAALGMRSRGVALGVEHVPQPELPHTLPPCFASCCMSKPINCTLF